MSKRQTKHRTAASKPEIKKLISTLKKDWKTGSDRVALGRQIQVLIGNRCGCTYRGLAGQIGRPESTLRRYVVLASLPKKERDAFLRGESAKAILARKAARDRQERYRARLRLEEETGSISDEVAGLILEFCRFAECIYSDVRNLLEIARRLTRNGEAYPIPGKIPLDHQRLFKLSRPPEWRGMPEFWLEHRGGWLAMILMTVAPEEDIREVAMNKAEHRQRELIPESPR